MEEKDDWTCGREGDRHPFTEINLQDEFVTPITLVLNYIQREKIACFQREARFSTLEDPLFKPTVYFSSKTVYFLALTVYFTGDPLE